MSKNVNYDLGNFESLQIKLASTEKMLEWSHGEVTKPETINYRSLKPERDGLFCERIFGPTKDWTCACPTGKYSKIRFKGMICPVCGVEITRAKVRRERMGHIKLASPVSHIWYFKGIPSRIGLVLDMTPKNLERVLYFASYVVIEPGESTLKYKELIDEIKYNEAKNLYGRDFKAGTGAEAIKELLSRVDPDKLESELREELEKAKGQTKARLVKRLEVIEALRQSGNKPEWMILEVIPVIPPDLRPMVQLDGGRFATSDLNDLYRRVINRNNRLKKLIELGAPDIIVRNEKRMLQESVDSLIDNGRRGRAVTGAAGRQLKSLSDMLKGKQGRFRQNLLGKRVDYSGRSVIVVGPELKFYQCGLPKTMALELFKPFIMKDLVEKGDAQNIKSAKNMVEKMAPEVWDALDYVIKDHPVLLNRAPTLHRLGIQAFEPVLVEGKAIKLHPLVCTAFNADFDGDQMAVHVPLSVEAQAEARFLMLSVNNILAPKDGSPITIPTQDMILGTYYLTHPGSEERNRPDEKGDGKCFSDLDEMMMAYQDGVVGIHAKVKVRMYADKNDKEGSRVESTVGRFIFNQGLPQDMGFVDRNKDPYGLEIDFLCGKKQLEQIIGACFKKHGNTKTVLMLDYVKSMGYKYSTLAAVTISVSDMVVPEEKYTIVAKADKRVDEIEHEYSKGTLTDEKRKALVQKTWENATAMVSSALMKSLDPMNNLNIMAKSGARGNERQISQIGGMRGLMANATGHVVEVPVKANFREGLSILEYFISANGARKGLADTALRTADSGYLTRRLVDVSHSVIVTEDDCKTDEGIEISALVDTDSTDVGHESIIEHLSERIRGRFAAEDIVNPKNNKLICAKDEEITDEIASEIEDLGIKSVRIRSIMTCKSERGVCAKCYGRNLATGTKVLPGEAVGIIAAQSIGEPGTQLTMRTFHTGGVAGNDITSGLPRVEELFESRNPKGLADIVEHDGVIENIEHRSDNRTYVHVDEGEGKVREYKISYENSKLFNKKTGDKVYAGRNLTPGPLNPQDIMRILGVDGVYQYLLSEVQKVYKQQGVDINDKHIEMIISRMLSKYKIIDSGDTGLLPGSTYSKFEIDKANEDAINAGLSEAKYNRVLLGITKAALATSSFLSAASFQETTRVLTDAAVKGKTDNLIGLKENVMIGKLIPAGTGMKAYRNIQVDYGEYEQYMNRASVISDDEDGNESSEIEPATLNKIDIESSRLI